MAVWVGVSGIVGGGGLATHNVSPFLLVFTRIAALFLRYPCSSSFFLVLHSSSFLPQVLRICLEFCSVISRNEKAEMIPLVSHRAHVLVFMSVRVTC